MNEDMTRQNETILRLREQIDLETQRLEQYTQGAQDERVRKLQKANEDLGAVEMEIKNIEEERDRLVADQDAAKAAGQGLEQELNRIKSQIDDARGQLHLIEQRERTKLAPFGQNLDRVLADIANMQWHGERPVGPIGQFVKVRDPKWAPLLRARLGNGMSIFAVTDPRDRAQLDSLLKRHGKYVVIPCLACDVFTQRFSQ